jgi:hypothetical protein
VTGVNVPLGRAWRTMKRCELKTVLDGVNPQRPTPNLQGEVSWESDVGS